MYRAVAKVIKEGAVEGITRAKQPTREEEFYRALRHSSEVFSAFKVHSMAESMRAKLFDDKGKLKPFLQWKQEVAPIASHHMGSWLQTEYNTAVLRAHNSADWRVFEANKDVMPNLRWMPTTSPHAEASHMVYWERKLTLPVDDPFWNKHHPGDRWNCKCSLEATDEPATPELLDQIDKPQPQRGLENNPGKDGSLFSDNHPYFPESCAKCAFYRKANTKNRLLGGFTNRRKDCYNCSYIDGCIDRVNAKKEISNAAFAKKNEVKQKDLMPKFEHTACPSLITGVLNRTNKVRNRLLTHCRHDYDVDAAVYIWNHPDKLTFEGVSPLGEGKDMDSSKHRDNIKRKQERGVIEYLKYSFTYKGRTFMVKLERCKNGYEQFYSLAEQ